LPPLTAVTHQRRQPCRSVQIEASAQQPSSRFVRRRRLPPLHRPWRHCRGYPCSIIEPSHIQLPASLSLKCGFASRPLSPSKRLQYYEGLLTLLTLLHLNVQVLFLLTPSLPFPTFPTSTTRALSPRLLCQSPFSAEGLFPGFATNEQGSPQLHGRNRFVILRTASSPPSCSPPPASRRRSYLRLWSCDQPQNGTCHRSDKNVPSRTHSSPGWTR